MSDIDKLTSAIATARARHDAIEAWGDAPTSAAICRGAMLEAIEILAELLLKAQSAPAPACQPEPSSDAYKFDEGLVPRLTHICATLAVTTNGWVWGDIVRAVLSELAKEPVELPDAGAVVVAWGFRGHICSGEEYAAGQRVAELVRARIAPAIAARDAEIARLSAEKDDSAAYDSDMAQENRKLQARIAELETAWDMLKKSLDESDLQRREGLACIADLEKRLAEQSAPVDASGKTPGQVFAAEFLVGGADAVQRLGTETLASMERGARAVLRVFGPQYAKEALQKMRHQVPSLDGSTDDAYINRAAEVAKDATKDIIDVELDKLGVSNG